VRKEGNGGSGGPPECIRKRRLAHALIHQPDAAFDARLAITMEEPRDIGSTLTHHVLLESRKFKRRSMVRTGDGAFRLDITCPLKGGGGGGTAKAVPLTLQPRHIIELEHVWEQEGPLEWTQEKTRRLLEITQTISK
jgi:hypothetical protein